MIKKINLKICDVTTWLTNNCKHILPNISTSKANQAMKFGQLMEYNLRSIFLKKSHTKCGGKTIPRPFLKKIKIKQSDQYSKVLYVVFLLFAKLKTIKSD